MAATFDVFPETNTAGPCREIKKKKKKKLTEEQCRMTIVVLEI